MTSTLVARLTELKNSPKQCKFSAILNSMDKECQALTSQIIAIPQEDPDSVSNVDLVLALRGDGYDIGRSTVSEHRRKICACYKDGVKN